MKRVEMVGSLIPLTESGKIVSNNISASCCMFTDFNKCCDLIYFFLDASIPHAWSEIGFLPAKMFPQLLLDNEESQYEDGTRTYVRFIKWVAR